MVEIQLAYGLEKTFLNLKNKTFVIQSIEMKYFRLRVYKTQPPLGTPYY